MAYLQDSALFSPNHVSDVDRQMRLSSEGVEAVKQTSKSSSVWSNKSMDNGKSFGGKNRLNNNGAKNSCAVSSVIWHGAYGGDVKA